MPDAILRRAAGEHKQMAIFPGEMPENPKPLALPATLRAQARLPIGDKAPNSLIHDQSCGCGGGSFSEDFALGLWNAQVP